LALAPEQTTRDNRHVKLRAAIAAGLLAVLVGAGAFGVSPDVPATEVNARWADARSRFVEIDGLRVHHRIEGDGPVLVLLHGNSSSLHTWEGWTAALSSRFKVVRLDLPGFGLTGPRPDRRYDVQSYSAFVADFLDRLGVSRASIAGNSLGGNIAWHFAAAHPERVEKLILLDAAGFPRAGPPPLPMRLARIPVLSGVLRWVSPRPLVEKSLREVYGDPSHVTPELVDRYLTLSRREGNRQAFIDRANTEATDDTALLKSISAPTLIMWGGRDRWADPADAERFHQAIAGSSVLRYPELGHIPMEEAPERTAADASSFLLPSN
jgi:pimeloyl-ACP methyl ester carboxylesterase